MSTVLALSIRTRLALLVAEITLFSCGVIPIDTYRNEHIRRPADGTTSEEVEVPRATRSLRFEELSNGVFIGVAMSGGGSRAANFGAAVLEHLNALGILRHTTIVSSVSGGSLAAAYYALYQPNSKQEWDRMRGKMGTDFFSSWLLKLFLPHNILRVSLTDYDRSDLMAEVFDGTLFNDAKFSNLGSAGPRIMINSTTLGQEKLTFSVDTFDTLGSRLDTYPISYAVMASGAFPLVFNSVTLAAYKESDPTATVRKHPVSYKHLFDGGPADNLGVDTLVEILDNFVASQPPQAPSVRGCFLVLVDASPGQPRERGSHERDPRRGFDFVFDRNAIDATDAMLWHQRRRLLQELAPADAVQSFRPVWNYSQQVIFGDGQVSTVPCLVWHLRFDRLEALSFAEGISQGMADFRRKTQILSEGAETHYKLTGLGCSSETIQTALYDAAEILAREDTEALRQVCTWLSDKGLSSDTCHPESPHARTGLLAGIAEDAECKPL